MANFNTHFIVASISSSIVSSTFLSMHIVTLEQGVLAFFLGSIGGLLPDLDSAHSIAIKAAFNILSLLITVVLIFYKYTAYSIVEMLLMSVFVFMGIRYCLIEIFRGLSKHRGMFHSVPAAIIWGLCVTIIMNKFFKYNDLISWVFGVMVSFGYLVHLILDEIYSVDLGNKRIKKSFGTALKFYRVDTLEERIQTAIIYALLVGLVFMAPDDALIMDALLSQEAWGNFVSVLIPNDDKWFFH